MCSSDPSTRRLATAPSSARDELLSLSVRDVRVDDDDDDDDPSLLAAIAAADMVGGTWRRGGAAPVDVVGGAAADACADADDMVVGMASCAVDVVDGAMSRADEPAPARTGADATRRRPPNAASRDFNAVAGTVMRGGSPDDECCIRRVRNSRLVVGAGR